MVVLSGDAAMHRNPGESRMYYPAPGVSVSRVVSVQPASSIFWLQTRTRALGGAIGERVCY